MSNVTDPKIDEIILLSGETFEDVYVMTDAPTLPGFIAITDNGGKTVQYIAHTAISSFSIKPKELIKISAEHFLTPTAAIRVKE